jgi:hypothetical protein
MCVKFDGRCDGGSHPFDQTLQVGDIIIIQKVDPTARPNQPSSYDNIPDTRGVPQNLIEGKVIFRIPYFG